MNYIEITAAVHASETEHAADVMRMLTGGGVWIETPFTQPDLESNAIPRTDAITTVHAYVAERAADASTRAAARAFRDAGIDAEVVQRLVGEEDWAESWKEYFDVERYGERIVVVPSWRRYEPVPGDAVITLDPGMAFGTGQHETTRMCLEALERHVRPGAAVLDAGCGSGILSLAAAALGARVVCALDVDPDCVRITGENARLNGIACVRAAVGSLGDTWPFDETARVRFDVVVANIIARVIIDLASPLVDALAPAGRLIVSGVIGERERDVVDALTAAGARVESVRAMGEWRCIEAVRA
jgi:ribosomal protein L11 methyltransferase